jgi:hypothetical protein
MVGPEGLERCRGTDTTELIDSIDAHIAETALTASLRYSRATVLVPLRARFSAMLRRLWQSVFGSRK